MKRPTNLTGTEAFTLIEVIIVAVCIVLISIPLFEMLRAGTKASLGGMIRVDTVMEAQRILKQVQADLKSACFPFNAGSTAGSGYSLSQVVLTRQSSDAREFFFMSFPLQGSVDDYVRKTGTFSYRQPSLIHYILEKNTDPRKPFYHLTREELFHVNHPLRATLGEKRSQVLSDRVNVFKIDCTEISTVAPYVSQPVCRVTLQLVDVFQPPSADAASDKSGSSPVPGYIIVDFYDVVYPEFLNTIRRQPFMNRAWQNWTDWKGN